MDVDKDTPACSSGSVVSVVASAGSSLTVDLHPLVILHIADHWSRVRAMQSGGHRGKDNDIKVIGVLLGRQDGRNVELINAFEVPLTGMTIDLEYMSKREEQYKGVFPDLDLVGWYMTDSSMAVTAADVELHKMLAAKVDSQLQVPLLLMKMTPLARSGEHLPMVIYESAIDTADEHNLQFVAVQHQLATQPVERIGVEHVARSATYSTSMAPTHEPQGAATSSQQKNSNAVQPQLQFKQINAMHGGVQMLRSRLNTIHQYVTSVQSGGLPVDHDIMRRVNALVTLIQTTAANEDGKEMGEEDTRMLSLLGNLTHSCGKMSSVIDRMSLMVEKTSEQSAGGGGARLPPAMNLMMSSQPQRRALNRKNK